MTTTIYQGAEVREIDLLDLFPASEGFIAQYYGKIGNGKTYNATADVLDALRRGTVNYVNWPIRYNGTDERQSPFRILITLLFPWLKRFYVFPKENLRYFEFSDVWARTQEKPDKTKYADFMEWFASRTDCNIWGDEGHIMFDSYQGIKMSIEKRATILHTRHFNRSIMIISQRPTAIHVAMRANVNIFYKCEKLWTVFGIIRFKRTEFQDMIGETVDEDPEKAVSIKYYLGKKAIFNAYDTTYLRKGLGASQKTMFKAYEFSYVDKLKLLWYNIRHKQRE